MGDAAFSASPGGPAFAAPCLADAFPLSNAPTGDSPGFGCGSVPAAFAASAVAAVPGGVGAEISGLLETEDLTPPILILSLITAMALGAAHALTPGHGKTIMAAYLVGTRGTARHALALGLTVTMSHTIGVLALAGVILALRLVTPESYNHVTGILSGLIVIGIGVWLFFRQAVPVLRARLAQRAEARAHVRQLPHGHEHEHEDEHPGHAREHDHEQGAPDPAGTHSHGAVRHSHTPATDRPLTWRALFALGLFGGLVPSINALIILLATLATGRAAYGLVLVVAFGAGMAIVLGGLGLGLVYASRLMEGGPSSSLFARIVGWAPALTAVIILVVGIYVTSQAILGAPVL
jgi:ABC-type nickel/cobalt efflux system permease component RcnA